MSVSFRELERLVRRAPLGLRCIDLAQNRPVSTGLRITARHVTGSGGVFVATCSPGSGLFGFYSLPGLIDYEWDRRPASDYVPAPDDLAPQNYVIAVDDPLGRFLPQGFRLTLPREQVVAVPLFAAPARPVTAAFGVVRATLWDAVNQRPAAWAVLRASVTGGDALALADARGVVALWVQYPAPQSAPQFGSAPLTDLTWPLTLTVAYQPGAQQRLAALPPSAPPDRDSLLAQASGTFAGGQPTLSSDLLYRQEVVLKTVSDPQSRLLIEPAPI